MASKALPDEEELTMKMPRPAPGLDLTIIACTMLSPTPYRNAC
jgi:hypothetical protein